MNANPYEPTRLSESDLGRTSPHVASQRALVHRPVFVVIWIVGYALASTGFFFALNYVDPCMPIDYPFYLKLFAAIGAVSGLLSWFVGHLVAASRMSVQTVAMLLCLPYLLVMFFALGLGPPIAVLATVIFGSVIALAVYVRPKPLDAT